MGLKDLVRNGSPLLVAGAVLLTSHAVALARGHCRSCCNPCPTMTGDFFGYYPTMWRPWPGTTWNVPVMDRPAAPTPAKPKTPGTEEPIPSPKKDNSLDPGKPDGF